MDVTRPGVETTSQHTVSSQEELLKEGQVRRHRVAAHREINQVKAELCLLITQSIHYETRRLGGTEDAIRLIASVASVPSDELWRLLSCSYRPTARMWEYITQILMVCHASRSTEQVLAAQRLFQRLHELQEEIELLWRRQAELSRRRREASSQQSAGSKQAVAGSSPGETDPTPLTQQGRSSSRSADSDAATPAASPAKSDVAAEPSFPPPPTPDVPGATRPGSKGQPLRPDPGVISSRKMFVETMRDYYLWAGKPSFREMERRCGKRISYSTFRNLLNSNTMPTKLEYVEIFVRVLGGTAEDLQMWATSWRRISMGVEGGETARDAAGDTNVISLPSAG